MLTFISVQYRREMLARTRAKDCGYHAGPAAKLRMRTLPSPCGRLLQRRVSEARFVLFHMDSNRGPHSTSLSFHQQTLQNLLDEYVQCVFTHRCFLHSDWLRY